VKFVVSPSLAIDPSNCSGATLMEGQQFNCTIVITTPGEKDNLNLSSNASFVSGRNFAANDSWFYAGGTVSASNYNYNVSISVTPGKKDVGNWTINFTADNGIVAPISKSLHVYVNFTESNITLAPIDNLNGSKALYQDYNFSVKGIDDDLLILDPSIKPALTFASNTSWVSYSNQTTLSGENYTTATFRVNHDYVLNNLTLGNGTYSVNINVTDTAGKSANRTFVIEILNDTAPKWNTSLSAPVSLNLTEDTAFSYNVSANVSDAEGDSVTFYYKN